MQIIPIDLHHFIQVKLKSRGDESLPLFQKNPRSISITSIKRVSRVSAVKKTGKTIEGTISTNEMDSHADTCVAGKNWGVLSYTDVVCEVTPFTDEYESIKEVPIVTACTVWTDQNTGKEYLLVGEQFLWFGTSLDHSLLNPNQIRANYLKVQDNPFEADSGISAVTNQNDDEEVNPDEHHVQNGQYSHRVLQVLLVRPKETPTGRRGTGGALGSI